MTTIYYETFIHLISFEPLNKDIIFFLKLFLRTHFNNDRIDKIDFFAPSETIERVDIYKYSTNCLYFISLSSQCDSNDEILK